MGRILAFLRRYHLPRSIIFFVVAAAAILLQVFPYTGIFLMFVLAPFWSVPLINLGFVGIAAEAVFRRVSIWWLILPILWFGGYWLAVGIEQAGLGSERERLRASNDSIELRFDPARQDLVMVADTLDMSNPVSHVIQHFEVPVVYSLDANASPTGYRARRIVPRSFADQFRDHHYSGAGISLDVVYEQGPYGPRISEDLRVIVYPEEPARPAVKIRTGRAVEGRLGTSPVTYRHADLLNTDGNPAGRLIHASASPLPWVPMPVIGCFLLSGPGKWECAAEFYRPNIVPLTTEDGGERGRDPLGELIGRALGLRSVPAKERSTSPTEPVLRAVRRAEAEAVAGRAARP